MTRREGGEKGRKEGEKGRRGGEEGREGGEGVERVVLGK